jgi:hypothetical protein
MLFYAAVFDWCSLWVWFLSKFDWSFCFPFLMLACFACILPRLCSSSCITSILHFLFLSFLQPSCFSYASYSLLASQLLGLGFFHVLLSFSHCQGSRPSILGGSHGLSFLFHEYHFVHVSMATRPMTFTTTLFSVCLSSIVVYLVMEI